MRRKARPERWRRKILRSRRRTWWRTLRDRLHFEMVSYGTPIVRRPDRSHGIDGNLYAVNYVLIEKRRDPLVQRDHALGAIERDHE